LFSASHISAKINLAPVAIKAVITQPIAVDIDCVFLLDRLTAIGTHWQPGKLSGLLHIPCVEIGKRVI
jgi:hypothetical protein